MKKVGIALIVIEILAVISGLGTGKSPFLKFAQAPGAANFFEVLGYLLPGIIGLVLIHRANKKAAAGSAADAAPTAHTPPAATGPAFTAPTSAPAERHCPKCGARAEDGDQYCVECGAKLRP